MVNMEMGRFQIEDISVQDMHGIVFRARDNDSGDTVALRRFFPFGKDGGGLEPEEAAAFGSASKRLTGVSHPALRSVIFGSVDPIDGIPYLVTEWVEGVPLEDILAGEPLDPALVIDVLRIALDVSMLLSDALGEEAVWIETDLQSIIVGTSESGRGFTFWISPFKWLGGEFESRKLSSIANLGEELAGWKRKIIGGHSGQGLGGWLRWLKENPDASLRDASEMLATSTLGESTPAQGEPAAGTGYPQPGRKSHGKALAFTAAIALLVTGLAIFHLKQTASPAHDTVKADPPTGGEREAAIAAAPSPAAEPDTPAQRASARAMELKAEMAKASAEAARKPATAKAPPTGAAPPAPDPDKIHSPADKALWASAKAGSPMKLGGVLGRVKTSSTGRSIYLFLDGTGDPGKLAGVIHKSTFSGVFAEETFAPMLGQKIVLTGTCFKEPGGRILAKILGMDQIQVIAE